MVTKDKFYIAGAWTPPASGASIEVHSPTDGALLARISQDSTVDVEVAVAAARMAFDAWAATPPPRPRRVLSSP